MRLIGIAVVALGAGCDFTFDLNRLPDPAGDAQPADTGPPDAEETGPFCQQPSQLTAVFCEDFDGLDASTFPQFEQIDIADPGTTYTITTSTPRSPPNAAQLHITTTGSGDARLKRVLSNANTFTVSMWARITEETTGANARLAAVHIGANHELFLRTNGALDEVLSQNSRNLFNFAAPPRNQWFRILFDVNLNTLLARVAVDGSETTTGLRSISTDTQFIYIGPAEPSAPPTTKTWTVLYDDVSVHETP